MRIFRLKCIILLPYNHEKKGIYSFQLKQMHKQTNFEEDEEEKKEDNF